MDPIMGKSVDIVFQAKGATKAKTLKPEQNCNMMSLVFLRVSALEVIRPDLG